MARTSFTKWPMRLEEAEALRDEKRAQMETIFQRVQALQNEMNAMEQELLKLDDHIDALENQTNENQQKPHTSLKKEQHMLDDVVVMDSPDSAAVAAPRRNDNHETQFTQSEILTDPATQFTQFTQFDDDEMMASSSTRTAAAMRPRLVSSSAARPAPLELAQATRQRRSNNQIAMQQPSNDDITSNNLDIDILQGLTSRKSHPLPTAVASSISGRGLKQMTLAGVGAAATTPVSRVGSNSNVASASSRNFQTPQQIEQQPDGQKDAIHRLLRDTFRIPSFRHPQEDIINATLAGQDAFVVMRTGGGKSLTYQLPALLEGRGPRRAVTLVVSPLISLIADQEYHFNNFAGSKTAAVSFTAGMGASEHAQRWASVQDARAGVCMVLVTPEKVHKSNRLRSEMQKLFAANRLARFVIDEAHCASQWGISFRPDYAKLGVLKRHFPTIPVLAVTATASEKVRNDVCEILGIQSARIFRSTADRPNLQYSVKVKPASSAAINAELASYIQTYHPTDSGIVYTLSRKEANTTAAALLEAGIPAAAYHSDVSTSAKDRVQRQWMDNRIQVVVATIAFGLGINKPDVRFVLHHCISKNLDSYYQESGRAGRDGLPANCVLYYSPRDVPRLRAMVEDTPGGADNLWPMVQYAQAFGNDAVCRAILLNSLGEPGAPSPMTVQQEHGDTTTVARDVGLHGKIVTQLVDHYRGNEQQITLSMLVTAWRAKKDVPDFVEEHPPKDLTVAECEQIVMALIIERILEFFVHWTAYQCVAYLRVGRRGEALMKSPHPKIVVRFPIQSKPAPSSAASKVSSSSSSSEWLTAKRKPAAKKKTPARKAVAAKKPAPKKKAATKVKTKRPRRAAAQKKEVPMESFQSPKLEDDVIELLTDEDEDKKPAARIKGEMEEELWNDNVEPSSDEEDEFEFY